jgi:hypothetical protein
MSWTKKLRLKKKKTKVEKKKTKVEKNKKNLRLKYLKNKEERVKGTR